MKKLGLILKIALITSYPALDIHGQDAGLSNPPALQADIRSDSKGIDLRLYMQAFETDLKSHWVSSLTVALQGAVSRPQVAVVNVIIAPDGHLSAMRLERNAQSAAVDKAALNAIRSTHFATLPAGLGRSSLKLSVRFLTN